MSKENKKCPSYDGGYCNTAPFPYSVKCCDLDCASQQIIVHDVDVKDCEFYETHVFKGFCNEIESDEPLMCSERKDCYYKKLQRIKKIAEEFQGYNRTGFEEILQIIEGTECQKS